MMSEAATFATSRYLLQVVGTPAGGEGCTVPGSEGLTRHAVCQSKNFLRTQAGENQGTWRPVNSRSRESAEDYERPRQDFCIPGHSASPGDDRIFPEAVLIDVDVHVRNKHPVLQFDTPPSRDAITVLASVVTTSG